MLWLPVVLAAACGGGSGDAPPAAVAGDSASQPAQDSAAASPAPAASRVVAAARGDSSAALAAANAAEPTSAFPHARHRSVQCTVCHASVAGHTSHPGVTCNDCHPAPVGAATTVAASADRSACRSCHHGARSPQSCTGCHGAGPTSELSVTQTLSMSVWPASRTRVLTFPHARHGSIACTRCHTGGTTLQFTAGCGACHASHHRADANCMGCHPAPAAGVHTAAVHRGCGGSGCHQDAAVVALPMTRSVCLTCHRDRVSHQPGRPCAECHLPPPEPGKAGRP